MLTNALASQILPWINAQLLRWKSSSWYFLISFLMLSESFFGTREPAYANVKTDTAQITSNIPFKAYTLVRFRLHLICFGSNFLLNSNQIHLLKLFYGHARFRPLRTLPWKKLFHQRADGSRVLQKIHVSQIFFGQIVQVLSSRIFFREAFSESWLRFCVKKILGSPLLKDSRRYTNIYMFSACSKWVKITLRLVAVNLTTESYTDFKYACWLICFWMILLKEA